MVKHFIQGRTWAQTPGEAMAQTARKLRDNGYCVLDGGLTIRPCPVQHRRGITWWEWQAEVIQVPEKVLVER